MRDLLSHWRGFLGDERGNVTLEVVLIFIPITFLSLALFELGISLYFILSAQKAAQLGARIAATRSPVSEFVPAINEINTQIGSFGDACFQDDGGSSTDGLFQVATQSYPNDACLHPGGPWRCRIEDGALSGGCDQELFLDILFEMRWVYPVAVEDVVIDYRYARLGFAGGPFVPHITVSILPRPSPWSLILFNWDVVKLQSDRESDEDRTFLRGVAASSIGEDVSSAN